MLPWHLSCVPRKQSRGGWRTVAFSGSHIGQISSNQVSPTGYRQVNAALWCDESMVSGASTSGESREVCRHNLVGYRSSGDRARKPLTPEGQALGPPVRQHRAVVKRICRGHRGLSKPLTCRESPTTSPSRHKLSRKHVSSKTNAGCHRLRISRSIVGL